MAAMLAEAAETEFGGAMSGVAREGIFHPCREV
jgi:hypothetical protein